jgi:hypothetical protein
MRRWHRSLAFTRIADLYGNSVVGGRTPCLDYIRLWNDRVRVNFASITIPACTRQACMRLLLSLWC